MNPLRLAVVLVAFAVSLGAQAAQAAIIFVNNQSSSSVAATGGADKFNYLDNDLGEPPFELNDENGVPTGIQVVVSSGTGANLFGNSVGSPSIASGSPADLAGFTATESATSHHTDNGVPGHYNLSGLNPALTYKFTLFGGRADTGTGTRVTIYSISNDGGATSLAEQSLTVLAGGTHNSTDVAVLSNIAPSAGGELLLTFVRDDNFDANFSYLNAWRIDVVPEPASIALAGFGALAVLIRRRRNA
jgi:hypothetical protein